MHAKNRKINHTQAPKEREKRERVFKEEIVVACFVAEKTARKLEFKPKLLKLN